MQVLIVNTDTGEIDADCPICGHGVTSDYMEFEDGIHMLIVVTDEETSALILSLADDQNGNKSYGMKVDMNKAKMKLDERVKIDVPIEIEGPGKPEISYIDQKPENIVIQKLQVNIETK